MGETVKPIEEALDLNNQVDLLLLDRELDENYGESFDILDGTPEEDPARRWLLAAAAFPEAQRSAQERGVRFLGGTAIRGETGEVSPKDTANNTTLLAAIQLASVGGPEGTKAGKVIRNNVGTDVAERLYKAAHQTKIRMRVEDGVLQQEGRKLTDLHRNALEHTVLNGEMLRRTKLELTNALMFEELHRKGVLADYNALVFSPSSTTMTPAEKKAYNLFVDTETCSIQMLSAEGDDVVLESAFVAGKRTPESERHDIQTIHTLADQRGIELPTQDGTDTIQYLMLVPKQSVEGIADVVSWYDDAAGGDTFYGQARPRQNYQTYAEECLRRAEGFEDMVEGIASALIREASSFKTPLDAILRLDELSEQFSVKRAVQDTSIDAAVFGVKAASHIQDARFFMQMGDIHRAESSLAMAQATAQSGSCPLFKGLLSSSGNPNDDPSGSNKELGTKEWMNCPYCSAKVFADPCAKKLSCWDCTALVVNGKIISKGNGGSRRRTQPEMAEQKPEPKVEAEASQVSIAADVDAAFRDRGVESFEDEQQKTQVKAAHAGKLALVGADAE
jgi:hypothetical protein